MDAKFPDTALFIDIRRYLFSSQRAASEALGVAIDTVNRWENSKRQIPKWAVELMKAWKINGGPRDE